MAADIEIVGNAGGEPETTTFQNGGSATTVSVAVNQGYMDKQTRQWVDQGTAWYRVNLYSDQAKQQAQFIRKGVKLIVTGGLKVREYQDRQGQQRQSLDLQARHVGIIHTEQRNGQGQLQGQQGGGFGNQRQGGFAGSRQQSAMSNGVSAPAPGAMAQDPWSAQTAQGPAQGQEFGGDDEPEF